MKFNYFLISSILYSFISIGQIVYILLMVIGMSETKVFPLPFIMLAAIVLISVILLILFPYLKNKSKPLKSAFGLFSFIFIIGTLIWVTYGILINDLSLFAILIMILYILSGILLLLKIGTKTFLLRNN